MSSKYFSLFFNIDKRERETEEKINQKKLTLLSTQSCFWEEFQVIKVEEVAITKLISHLASLNFVAL